MISGQQLKQVLDYGFTNGSGFMGPTGSLTSTPSLYTTSNLPASVVLSGSVIPNDAQNINWTLVYTATNTTVLTGTGSILNYNLPVVPAVIGSYTYNWNISYDDLSGNTFIIIITITIQVIAASLYGQINNPVQIISVPADLLPYEPSLTVSNQSVIINLFSVVATNTGRIVITVPDSYGTVTSITDNTSLDITSQFSMVNDPGNSRKLYTTNVVLTPGTYYFKVNF